LFLVRNKFMHVITYSPNFAPPHFAACGIPKNTPTAQWKVTLFTFTCLFTPFGWSFFLFFFTQSTLARPDVIVKYGKG